MPEGEIWIMSILFYKEKGALTTVKKPYVLGRTAQARNIILQMRNFLDAEGGIVGPFSFPFEQQHPGFIGDERFELAFQQTEFCLDRLQFRVFLEAAQDLIDRFHAGGHLRARVHIVVLST
jgi:hypothetical protein